ncbi:FAD-binding oxidoreductase [Rhodococcus globerulus]|uniref:FAD-linked oxidase C-terminal domain-containing protein n=1 Tax=Rhodococcus globerulus TaxID=33008 RepID=A0ABU4C3W7_RHOGO|nr:FAD-linked oxidase C-terminal domain-containing protein [Rhodococcus globerulus]MDV6271197.1 FAD-linked oxidase C-terminal domain-containing protein [Rhodococcus globerulus]
MTASFVPVLPEGDWIDTPEIVDAHRWDRSGWRPAGQPRGLVVARSVADVQALLRQASDAGIPVVPRGAGSGLAGGAAATDGSVILDLSRMNRILEIVPRDRLAVVEPGVVTADLDHAAGAVGLRYAPDPASVAISTIGGNIATNAGGLRCAKYGATRESVLGLDVVLADGRLIHTGRRTVKGVAGYDLTSLFVGSEGTLGVVVGATVKLRPLPSTVVTLGASFESVDEAAAAAAAVGALDVEPAMAELLDSATLGAVADHLGRVVDGGAYLLVQTDGSSARHEAEVIAEVLRQKAISVEVAADDARAEQLIELRRSALPALERLGRVFIEDVSVPRSQLAEMIRAVADIAARTETSIYTFAHAADGTVHPLVVTPFGDEQDERALAAADEIFSAALRLGGTVTGEHGIGALKRRWLDREVGPDVAGLHQAIRRTLDAKGILNPGKAV